jgi:hypothetical protein
VRLLIDVRVGILCLLVIDELRIHIPDQCLERAVLILLVIVQIWRLSDCCHFIYLLCTTLLLFLLICRQSFIESQLRLLIHDYLVGASGHFISNLGRNTCLIHYSLRVVSFADTPGG